MYVGYNAEVFLSLLPQRVNHQLYSRFRQNHFFHRIQEVIAKGEASNIVDVDGS